MVGLGYVEGFMDIERFDLKVEGSFVSVSLEPPCSPGKNFGREVVRLGFEVFDVAVVAPALARPVDFYIFDPLRHNSIFQNRRLPKVDLMPAHQFGAVKGLDIAVRLFLPVMVVIGDDGGNMSFCG